MDLAGGECPEELRFQLLSHLVDIRYQDAGLTHTLQYMNVSATQAFKASRTLHYTITGRRPWAVFEEGDFLQHGHCEEDVLHLVYRRAYQRMLEPYIRAGWVQLHAGLVSIAGCRMILMGDKGAGKTTLVSRLMLAGHEVEGDEAVLVRAGLVTAMPRRLHLKEGTCPLLPELADILDALPGCHGEGQWVRALDPCEAGFNWHIDAGPVDAIIWLTPNHGGEAQLRELGSMDTLKHLLDSHLDMGESRQQAMNNLPPLATGGGYQLTVGNTASTQRALEGLAHTLSKKTQLSQ